MTFFDWKKEPARYKQYLEEVDNGVLIGELDDLDQYYLLLSMFPKMNDGFKNWADDWAKHCALFRSENM